MGARTCDVYNVETMCPLMEEFCEIVDVPSCGRVALIESSECSLLPVGECTGNSDCVTAFVCRGRNDTGMDLSCAALDSSACASHPDCETVELCSAGTLSLESGRDSSVLFH